MEVTAENYFSKETHSLYMSVSQLKAWLACPAAAYAEYVLMTYEKEEKICLVLGKYFHGKFDGSATAVLTEYFDILHTQKREKLAPVKQIDEMYERVSKDALFMSFCTGEHELIFTFEMFGIMWKIMVDVIDFDRFGGFFADIKTVKSFAKDWNDDFTFKVPFYIAMKYDIQLAVYQAGIEIATGFKLLPAIPAVTKEKVPDFAVFDFTSADADTHFAIKLNEVKHAVENIQAMKAGQMEIRRCGFCDYCRKTKQLTSTTMAMF